MKNEEIICYCSNVTKNDILKAIQNGAKTLDDIRKMTSACTVGRCAELSPTSVTLDPIKKANCYIRRLQV